ncbi:MAG: hypothetical protein H6733_06205 [Alphaproteobacteria bacterium]|nr:hypothetical protein [Alphaproteobacteria bacterium]
MDPCSSLFLWAVLTASAGITLGLGGYTVRLERDTRGRSVLVASWAGWWTLSRTVLGEIRDVRVETGSGEGGVYRVMLATADGEVPVMPFLVSGRAGREQEAERVLRHVVGEDRVTVRRPNPVLLVFGAALGTGSAMGVLTALAALGRWLVG